MKRGRNQRRRQGVNPNRALDSNGPDVRIRGTANQIYDKYQTLARDAASAGDRVKAENYLQHAEHYFRVIRSIQANQPTQNHNNQNPGDGEQPNASDESDQGNDEQPRSRGRRNSNGADRNNDDADNTASNNDEAEAASDSDDAGDASEKKPRRRRAPRKSTRAASDDDAVKDAEPAAAE